MEVILDGCVLAQPSIELDSEIAREKVSGLPCLRNGRLHCQKCGFRSIPAPKGANERTGYVCAQCSPLGVAVDAQFDRCQFDGTPSSANASLRVGPAKYIQTECDRILLRYSSDVAAARQRGEAWVKHATAENIRMLPERSARALLLTMWSGLTAKEVAIAMGIKSPDAVYHLVLRAKRKLAACQGNRQMLRDKRTMNHTPKTGRTAKLGTVSPGSVTVA